MNKKKRILATICIIVLIIIGFIIKTINKSEESTEVKTRITLEEIQAVNQSPIEEFIPIEIERGNYSIRIDGFEVINRINGFKQDPKFEELDKEFYEKTGDSNPKIIKINYTCTNIDIDNEMFRIEPSSDFVIKNDRGDDVEVYSGLSEMLRPIKKGETMSYSEYYGAPINSKYLTILLKDGKQISNLPILAKFVLYLDKDLYTIDNEPEKIELGTIAKVTIPGVGNHKVSITGIEKSNYQDTTDEYISLNYWYENIDEEKGTYIDGYYNLAVYDDDGNYLEYTKNNDEEYEEKTLDKGQSDEFSSLYKLNKKDTKYLIVKYHFEPQLNPLFEVEVELE